MFEKAPTSIASKLDRNKKTQTTKKLFAVIIEDLLLVKFGSGPVPVDDNRARGRPRPGRPRSLADPARSDSASRRAVRGRARIRLAGTQACHGRNESRLIATRFKSLLKMLR